MPMNSPVTAACRDQHPLLPVDMNRMPSLGSGGVKGTVRILKDPSDAGARVCWLVNTLSRACDCLQIDSHGQTCSAVFAAALLQCVRARGRRPVPLQRYCYDFC